jgi:hypothetical protein
VCAFFSRAKMAMVVAVLAPIMKNSWYVPSYIHWTILVCFCSVFKNLVHLSDCFVSDFWFQATKFLKKLFLCTFWMQQFVSYKPKMKYLYKIFSCFFNFYKFLTRRSQSCINFVLPGSGTAYTIQLMRLFNIKVYSTDTYRHVEKYCMAIKLSGMMQF